MQYIIADRGKVLLYGIRAKGHRQKEGLIVVNEKELNVVPGLTPADRVKAVDGTLYSASEIKRTLQEEGWK